MKHYMMIVRHEPDTHRESASAWWYSHHRFEEENDGAAIEKARHIQQDVGTECSHMTMRRADYGCKHSVDELYRIEGESIISIYDDGVYQSTSWDTAGKPIRVKRATDNPINALLGNPLS